MKTFDRLETSPLTAAGRCFFAREAPHPKARRVWGVIDGRLYEAGWLMPQYDDTRQQPRSLAYKLREKLNREAA